MPEPILSPRLLAHVRDVEELFSVIEEPRALFELNEGETCNHYICTSFTLTLNKLFILELEERSEFFAMVDAPRCFVDAASADDIANTIWEMRCSDSWACLCRLPDGNFAVLTDQNELIEDTCRVFHILAMSHRRNE